MCKQLTKAIEIESSRSVNLCICRTINSCGNITSGVIGSKVLTFLKDLQNHRFGQHTGEVRVLSYIWQGNTASYVLRWWSGWTVYVPYIHNLESAWKILRTRLKDEMVVLENSP